MIDADVVREFVAKYKGMTQPVAGGGLSETNIILWTALLCAQARRGWVRDMSEVGVWHGHASTLMAQHLPPNRRLLLIDKFVELSVPRANIIRALPDADQRIDFRRVDSRHAQKTGELANYASEVSFFHIDGEHSYEAVCSDLDLAAPCLSDGGVIALDDMFDTGCPSLTEGLFHWLRINDYKAVLFLAGFNKAYLCAPVDLPFYLRFCYQLPEIFDALNQAIAITRSGWSAERACIGLIPSHGTHRYIRIGNAYDHLSYEEFFLGRV
jgi:predicted O-methyltransferase YrrM